MINFAKATAADALRLCDVATLSFDDDARRFFALETGGPPRYNELQYHVELADSRAYAKPHNYRKCRKAPCFSYGDIRHNLLENSMFFNRFKSFDCII